MNTKHYFEEYIAPELEVSLICPKSIILAGSVNGYVDAGEMDEVEW